MDSLSFRSISNQAKLDCCWQTAVNDNNNIDNINNDEENDDYDCDHKIAKQEQRNRENRFDGLRLSSDVRLSVILFLI